jgi:hypothetical protein
MKKIILSISALLFLTLVSCGPGAKQALAYNDHLMTYVNIATLVQNDFFDQTDGHNMDSLVITQKHFSEKTKECLDEISKVEAFAEKKEFLNAAIGFVKTLNSLADNEGKQMTDIMTKDTVSITGEDIKKVEDLSTKLNDESNRVSKEIVDAQEAFAKEWKFEIGKEHK